MHVQSQEHIEEKKIELIWLIEMKAKKNTFFRVWKKNKSLKTHIEWRLLYLNEPPIQSIWIQSINAAGNRHSLF